MRKFWQKEWKGLQFSKFIKTDSKTVAGSEFYNEFYTYFYKIMKSWNDLSPNWFKQKKTISDFIINDFIKSMESDDYRILSIGCGLGIIEKNIYSEGFYNIDVNEISDKPLLWLKKLIPQNQIFTGLIHETGVKKKNYDLIHLVAVDYVFNKKDLTVFLNSLKELLKENGQCLLISGSFYETGFSNMIKSNLVSLKKLLCRENRGQLWGYLRSNKDYTNAMNNSGYNGVLDGMIDGNIYFIKGIKK